MRMKNKAAGLLKKMMAIFNSAKSITDLKSKLRDLKARLMIYSLLSRDKKVLFGSISHKFHDLFLTTHHRQPIDQTEQPIDQTEQEEEHGDLHQQPPLVICNNIINAAALPPAIVKKVHTGHDQKEDEEQKEEISIFISNQEDEEEENQEEDDDEYPDLRHSLFEDEDDEYEMGRPGSVIELVKKSKEARKGGGEIGEEFKLEDEIDEVADLFIKRFHRHMLIQKQNSLKRRTAHQYN